MVNEFPDVFPDELSGLPPQRDMVFTIELEPKASPISEAPYCMVQVDMVDLKNQLEELVESRYIQSSVQKKNDSFLLC